MYLFIFCVLCLCLKDYIDAHPETIVLDPLPAIRTLLDRCKSYQLVRRIESCMQGKTSWVKVTLTGSRPDCKRNKPDCFISLFTMYISA